jgi:hypothetical protein
MILHYREQCALYSRPYPAVLDQKGVKMLKPIFVIVVLTALVISACSLSKPEAIKTALPTLEGGWTIHMTHSGGIMGLSRSITIASDGKYTVVDERANKSVEKVLGPGELAKLRDIVANSNYLTLAPPRPSACADCFIYDIAINGNGSKFSVQLDDISLTDSGMAPLVAYLRDLIDAALK